MWNNTTVNQTQKGHLVADYKTQPQARILADSISPDGHRLTTMEVTFNRFVLAEFNTHRVFSRNSASSRAIPGSLQRQRVLDTPAFPLRWPERRKGMQGGGTLPDELQTECDAIWNDAAADAVAAAEKLDDLGVHKSVSNRLLEPFTWHTVIVTATEWDNYFGLRDSELAQPEIAYPSKLMREAYEASEPQLIDHGKWHTPLIQQEDHELIAKHVGRHDHMEQEIEEIKRKVSAARCARVSYLTHEGKRDIAADIKLYNRLTSADPPHASPLEHVATPCEGDPHVVMGETARGPGVKAYEPHLGNFNGWDQLRHMEGM